MKRAKKRLGVVFLALVMAFALVGCDNIVTASGDDGEKEASEPGTDKSFLGRGYDVLNSPFYQSKYVKNEYVFNMALLNEHNHITEDKLNNRATETINVVGKTIEEYSKSLSLKVGIGAKIGAFKGSIDTDFGTAQTFAYNKSFAKSTTILTKERHYISGVSIANLRNDYLDTVFKECLMTDNPSQLLSRYGTHILLNVFLGGRLDMSYLIESSLDESSSDIEMKVSANYKVVSGNTSTEIVNQSKSLRDNSLEIIHSYGGSVGYNLTSFEQARVNYTNWAQSIETTNNLAFVNGGNLGIMTEMLPIWELIDPSWEGGQARREAIEAEYNRQLDQCAADVLARQSKPRSVYSITWGKEILFDDIWFSSDWSKYKRLDTLSDIMKACNMDIDLLKTYYTKAHLSLTYRQHSNALSNVRMQMKIVNKTTGDQFGETEAHIPNERYNVTFDLSKIRSTDLVDIEVRQRKINGWGDGGIRFYKDRLYTFTLE